MITFERLQLVMGITTPPDCPLAYTCFKVHHKLMAIDPIKKQALNSDPKTMQEINFVGNL